MKVSSLLVVMLMTISGALVAAAPNTSGFRALSGNEAANFVVPSDVQLVHSFRMATHGLTYERYQQYFGIAEVLGAQLTLYRNDAGTITTVIGSHYPFTVPTNVVALSETDARTLVDQDIGTAGQRKIDVLIDPTTGRYFYRVETQRSDSRWFHWINAGNGQVLNRYDGLTNDHGIGVKGDTKSMTGLTTFHPESSGYWLQSSGNRQLTYDDGNNGGTANIMIDTDNHWIAPGRPSPGQAAGVDAQYYAKIVDDYYSTVHSRNSFNNNGASMQAIVHYLNNYDNAFWNGSLVVFGDGDGVYFREFSGALDVVGHEWTHAVTDYTSHLVYQNESGALNESFSDIMGTSIEFFAAAQGRDPAGTPDWLIGEDIDLQGNGFRNMADPGADGDPDHYTERYTGTGDNGGVHTNSGIPNHAYYLLVNGGPNAGCVSPNNHPHCTDSIDPQDNNLTVTGIGLTAAEKIFYLGFTGLPSNATMCNARAATEAKASALFGSASPQKLSTTNAWVAVGLTDAVCGGAPPPPPPPPPSPTMHVGDLDGSRANAQGNKWNATVTITIHDGNHQPLASATVSGSWSAGASGSASCTTNSSGQCSVTKSSLSKGTNSVTFTVTAVTHAPNTYQANANHDPDGVADSNGTSITVRKP